MQVADDPQRTCRIQGGYPDSAIVRIGAIRVEQQAGPVSPVEQRFHPLHNGTHPCANCRRIDGGLDRLPIELPDVDDRRGHWGFDDSRNGLWRVDGFNVKLGGSLNLFRMFPRVG